MSFSFNQTCLNKVLLPNYTLKCVCVCVRVCVCVSIDEGKYKTGSPPSGGYVNITEWIHHMDSN